MKKYLLLLLFVPLFSFVAVAQTTFGVGAAWQENVDFGVEARAKLPLGETFDIIPSFNYWFTDGTVISLDAVLAYDVATVSNLPIYALGGLDWTRASLGGFSNSELGINLGAGTIVGGNIYIEPRWTKFLCDGCGSSLSIHGGYYFGK